MVAQPGITIHASTQLEIKFSLLVPGNKSSTHDDNDSIFNWDLHLIQVILILWSKVNGERKSQRLMDVWPSAHFPGQAYDLWITWAVTTQLFIVTCLTSLDQVMPLLSLLFFASLGRALLHGQDVLFFFIHWKISTVSSQPVSSQSQARSMRFISRQARQIGQARVTKETRFFLNHSDHHIAAVYHMTIISNDWLNLYLTRLPNVISNLRRSCFDAITTETFLLPKNVVDDFPVFRRDDVPSIFPWKARLWVHPCEWRDIGWTEL